MLDKVNQVLLVGKKNKIILRTLSDPNGHGTSVHFSRSG